MELDRISRPHCPFHSRRWLAKARQRRSTKNSLDRLFADFVNLLPSKNFFKDSNRDILRSAESVYGEDFQRDSALPHLICRTCERRVNNFITFKNIICETQRSLREDIRTKRCIELLPSVPKPPLRVLAAGSSRCRSIDFNVAGSESDRSESVAQTVPLHVSLF